MGLLTRGIHFVFKCRVKLNVNSLQEDKLQQNLCIRSDFQLNEMAFFPQSDYTPKYGQLSSQIEAFDIRCSTQWAVPSGEVFKPQ